MVLRDPALHWVDPGPMCTKPRRFFPCSEQCSLENLSDSPCTGMDAFFPARSLVLWFSCAPRIRMSAICASGCLKGTFICCSGRTDGQRGVASENGNSALFCFLILQLPRPQEGMVVCSLSESAGEFLSSMTVISGGDSTCAMCLCV